MRKPGLWERVKRSFVAPGTRTFAASPYGYESPAYSLLIEGMFRQNGRGTSISTRMDAMELPAVLRGRDQVCTIATLPLEAVNARNEVVDHPLFRQVDPNVANVVTLAQTVEDLLFDGVAWWKVTKQDGAGYPVNAIRMDPSQVSLTPPAGYHQGYLPSELPTEGVVYMKGEPVPHSRVIRFDSPRPALMKVLRRILARAIAIDLAALRYAENPRPADYFAPRDPANGDPFADDENGTAAEKIARLLEAWKEARAQSSTAYVPAALEYNSVQQPTPADLQLVSLMALVDKQIAIAIGLDPEEVGVNTTSRVYQNDTDRRKNKINELLSFFMAAITQRLTMPDVTKRGVFARFNLDDFLRADPKTRAEVQQVYHDMRVMSREWIARQEGLPPEAMPPAEPAPELPQTPVSPATIAEINSAAREVPSAARES